MGQYACSSCIREKMILSLLQSAIDGVHIHNGTSLPAIFGVSMSLGASPLSFWLLFLWSFLFIILPVLVQYIMKVSFWASVIMLSLMHISLYMKHAGPRNVALSEISIAEQTNCSMQHLIILWIRLILGVLVWRIVLVFNASFWRSGILLRTVANCHICSLWNWTLIS